MSSRDKSCDDSALDGPAHREWLAWAALACLSPEHPGENLPASSAASGTHSSTWPRSENPTGAKEQTWRFTQEKGDGWEA